MQSQGARKEARLRNLVKLRAWAEQKAREAKKNIPDKLDIGLDGNGNDNNVSASENGAAGDAVMTSNGDVDPMIS